MPTTQVLLELCIHRVVQKKIAQSLMLHRSAIICSRITWFSPKCSQNIAVDQSVQNLYQLVKYLLINSQSWIHVVSDVTQHVNMTPLTVEDRLLIKTFKLKKAELLEKMIVEFPARQWKWHMLFDLFTNIIESTGFVKRLSGSDLRRLE